MRKGGRPSDARPLSPYGEVLRRDLLDLHVAHAGDRAARVDEADLAEELTARRCGRQGGDTAGDGRRGAGAELDRRVGDGDGAQGAGEEHVLVVVRRGTGRDRVAGDLDGVRAGGGRGDRDGLLRVAVGGLADHGARRVVDRQVQGGGDGGDGGDGDVERLRARGHLDRGGLGGALGDGRTGRLGRAERTAGQLAV